MCTPHPSGTAQLRGLVGRGITAAETLVALKAGLVVQRVGDVRVHVADLAASCDQHDDDNQSDQNQDEGVLDQTLPSLPSASDAVKE